jgi:SOS-response transcriptional repressor LexA
MSSDLGSILARIDERLRKLGISADAASKRAGKPDSIRNLKRAVAQNRKHGFNVSTAKALAAVLDVSPNWLLDGEEPPALQKFAKELPVLGVVEAGAWREAFEEDSPTMVVAGRDGRFPNARQFLLEVRGDSMNAAQPQPMPDGSLIRCVDWADTGLAPRSGLIVVCRRMRGELFETTVKRIHRHPDGSVELRPESTNPAHKNVYLDGDDETRVEILALVTAVIHEF